jgi:SAM-dependent methyltransferase
MPGEHELPVFEWVLTQLTVDERAGFVERITPHLEALIEPGGRALDLGCGTGPVAFRLEELGARVTAIDLTVAMIERAREEAAQRGSNVEFIQGDILAHDFGDERFDLVVCLGDVLQDIPHEAFGALRDRVHEILKPGGGLVIGYVDGVARIIRQAEPGEKIVHDTPHTIVRHFRQYDPARGAYTAEYRNANTGEVSVYSGYTYTRPLLRLAMEPKFARTDSIRMDESEFLDIFRRCDD